MNYEIVIYEQELREFVAWLPELEEHEKYYCAVFSRKKYDPLAQGRSTDKHSCGRFLATKDNLINKIKQFEIVEGGFLERNGTPVTQKSLCVYINPNPRDLKKASGKLLVKLAEQVSSGNLSDPTALAMTTVHQTPSKKRFIDFDFDNVDLNDTKKAIVDHDIINTDCLHILNTKGGFHILVEIAKIEPKYQKKFYTQMCNLYGVDVVGDNLVPVPGCTQGMHVPSLCHTF